MQRWTPSAALAGAADGRGGCGQIAPYCGLRPAKFTAQSHSVQTSADYLHRFPTLNLSSIAAVSTALWDGDEAFFNGKDSDGVLHACRFHAFKP